MSDKLNRRTMLAGAAVLPALSVPAIAGVEAAPDPIFALIEHWKELVAVEDRAFRARDGAFQAAQGVFLEQAAERATDARVDATRAVFEVVPTTLPGMRTKIDFAFSFDYVTNLLMRSEDKTARKFIDTMYEAARRMTIASAAPTSAGRPVSAVPAVDPIYAAITAHKAAISAFSKAADARSALEIANTDDPRWIDAEEKVRATSEAMDETALSILKVKPTTLEGAIAVLRYAVDHVDRFGEMMGWPEDLRPDGGDIAKLNASRSPEYFLMQNVGACLARLSGQTSAA